MAERFTWHYGVLKEIAQSKEIQGVCLRCAQNVAQRATAISKQAYRVDVRVGSFRAHARASTTGGEHSLYVERQTRALLRTTPKL